MDAPRKTIALAAAAAVLVASAASAPATGAPASGGSSPQAAAAGKAKRNRAVLRAERGIRKCANSRRRARGMKPLELGLKLGRAARYHAQKMAKAGFFDHVDPQGNGPAQRVARFGGAKVFSAIGENIAAGQRSADAACRDWMASSGHRANILGGYTHIGGGFSLGGRYKRYYVMVLGRARG